MHVALDAKLMIIQTAASGNAVCPNVFAKNSETDADHTNRGMSLEYVIRITFMLNYYIHILN